VAPSLDDDDHSGEGGDHAGDDRIYAGNENRIGDPRILLVRRFSLVREPRLDEVRVWNERTLTMSRTSELGSGPVTA
jgi:hypothetical protein